MTARIEFPAGLAGAEREAAAAREEAMGAAGTRVGRCRRGRPEACGREDGEDKPAACTSDGPSRKYR